MNIRKAAYQDLDIILEIYSYARSLMVITGNPNQWGEEHPRRGLIEQDITRGISYVCEDDHGIQGVFVVILGEDHTYAYIEDGKWLNDDSYGTIHRIASAGKVKGVATQCFDWCYDICRNLRIDTHEDNKIMQHLVVKSGFEKCGRIYVDDGSPRIAYQRVK